MTEIKVRSSKMAKTGNRRDGAPWSLIAVVDDTTGIEYTTFDTKADCPAGTVLEIGDPDIKEGKFSFKKCDIVSSPSVQSGPNGQTNSGPRSSMSPDDWAKKDRMERMSYESQTAFKGVVDLIVATLQSDGVPEEVINPLLPVYQKALKWAEAHLSIIPTAQKASTTKGKKGQSEEQTKKDIEELWPNDGATFENVGEFLTECQKIGVSRKDIMERFELSEAGLKKLNLTDAWTVLNEEKQAQAI